MREMHAFGLLPRREAFSAPRGDEADRWKRLSVWTDLE